jgi:hypothetical protein
MAGFAGNGAANEALDNWQARNRSQGRDMSLRPSPDRMPGLSRPSLSLRKAYNESPRAPFSLADILRVGDLIDGLGYMPY